MLRKTCVKDEEIGKMLSGQPAEAYEIPRTDEYEETFIRWLRACGFDDDGEWLNPALIPFIGEDGLFENDTFALFPYYWGDDDALIVHPNFLYKLENIKIYWYKHPFRDATISKDMSPDEFGAMLGACLDSLRASIASVSRGRGGGAH